MISSINITSLTECTTN